jgi:HAD superfamily hydrolase (TIGR01459 family)
MPLPILSGLSDLADRYDGFILDAWGVMHDGVTPYPYACDTLERLQAAGKRTVILSNAPRRSEALYTQMEGIGVPRRLYGSAMTSGEAVYRALEARRDPFYAGLGARCWHLGPDRDRNVIDGLPFTAVAVEQADWVLNTGPDPLGATSADYERELRIAAERGLPMVCANPDLVIIRAGKRIECAGALARRYEELGGTVSYRGKPDPAIYDACLEVLEMSDRRRVLCVGDAFHTDIAGGLGAGFDVAFVAGGVHHGELGIAVGETPSPEALQGLIAHHDNILPTCAMPLFKW